jgi:hypothetical protein
VGLILILRGRRLFVLLIGISIVIQSFSQPVAALEFHVDKLNLELRDFFRAKVENSDRFIDNFNEKADGIVNDSIGAVSFYTRQGFSTLETFTGLSEQNQLYRYSKNNWLKTIGFGLGVLKGTKDFAAGTVSLLAYLESSPARTITLAYNVQERPQEYKEKATGGAAMLAGILANPRPVLGGIYQLGKDSLVDNWTEAQKDPLKMGQLQGEVGVFGASLFVGGGQLKAVSNANKAKNTAKAGGVLEKAVSTETVCTVAGTSDAGILAKASASINNVDLGSLLPDLSLPNLGYYIPTPALAGTGKVFTASLFSPTTKGKGATHLAQKTRGQSTYPLTMSDVEKLFFADMRQPKNALQKFKSFGKGSSFYKLPAETEEQLLAWGHKTYGKWARNLSDEDMELLMDYTLEFYPFNRILRSRAPQPAELEKINRLSSIIQSAPALQEEIIVFRGGSKSILGDLHTLPLEQLEGKVLTDAGFISTSLIPKQAKYFSRGVFMVIKVPKGAKGAYIDATSGFNGEREFLLDHGQEFFINKAVRTHGKKVLLVDLL